MIKSKLFPKNLIDLVPADTWHQPEYKDNSEKPEIYIECDHKCGKAMSTITSAFEELSVRSDEVLCEHTVTEFALDLKPGTTLAEVRRQLTFVKSCVGHLKLTLFDGFGSDQSDDCIDKRDFQLRLMEIIGIEAAGPKLQEMTIKGIDGISKKMLECLAPALKKLEALTINTSRCNILYLMPTFCPKLETFHLLGSKWTGDGSDAPVQSWPTLNCLTITNMSFDVESDTESGKRLRRLFSLNPQIEILEADFMVENSLLKVIAKSMRELKTLTIVRHTFEGFAGVFNQLVRLKRLQSIMVTTWNFRTCHFKSLLASVECFSKMKRLELTTLIQNYVHDGKKVIVVNDFPVTYHQNCYCHGQNNRVLTFGNLTEPISLPKDKRTLVLVVSVARDQQTAGSMLEARISTMFKGTNKFYPNVHKTTIITDEDQSVLLHVASTL